MRYISHSCYYVDGKIGQVRGKFLVDTGSSICVIPLKLFDKLADRDILLKPTDRKVQTADGNFLKLRGNVCYMYKYSLIMLFLFKSSL